MRYGQHVNVGIRAFCALLFAAFLVGTAAASYFEKEQVRLLLPIRDFFEVPEDARLDGDRSLAERYGVPLKASKDGYYVNPHQLTSLVYEDATRVIRSGDCALLLEGARIEIDRASQALAELAQEAGQGGVVWAYPIHFTYGLRPGWISAMAQARAAVVLYAASLCESDDAAASAYRALSRRALEPFQRTVEEGGVIVALENESGVWFEEYAQPGIEPPLVLNGHIYALLALRDLNDAVRSPDVSALIEKGLNAVRERIDRYDIGVWSMYDQAGTVANQSYQALHTRQMGQLHEWSGEDIFARYRNKFALQLASPVSALYRLWLQPTRALGVVMLLDLFLAMIVITMSYVLVQRTRRRRSRRRSAEGGL